MTNGLFRNYNEINKRYIDTLLEFDQQKSMIWIHDIQLLLTPYYLKRRVLTANIGFYMHSPFPSSDIFKTSQWRVEIMRSMLCCDVIGFHLFEYARNFFTAC